MFVVAVFQLVFAKFRISHASGQHGIPGAQERVQQRFIVRANRADHRMALRQHLAWHEQAALIAMLAAAAAALNAATTGQHLGTSVQQGLWAVAGMDAMLLVTSALAWLAWHRLRNASRRASSLTLKPRARAVQGESHHA